MRIRFLLPLSLYCGLLCLLAGTVAAAADPPPTDDAAPTTRLTISPAAAPHPALRYRLLPTVVDLRPGNAAVFYIKAALMYAQSSDRAEAQQKIEKWLEMPLDELPQGEMAEYVAHWERVINELRYGALREDCDWQTPLREQPPYTVLLPEQQEMRNMARLLAAKARLEIAQGRIDDALQSLTIGYAMARHAARGPTLIQSLVGMAIGSMMTNQAREISQRPESPNLYWAYTSLPRPFVSLDRANGFEFDMFYVWHPEWRDRSGDARSPAEWQRVWESLATSVGDFDSSFSDENGRLRLVGRAIQRYPLAKRYLIDGGRSPDEVERMPVAQVMMVYSLDTFDQLRDEQFKWAGLPYWQIHDRLREANEQLRRASEEREVVPLAGTLLPAISNVALSQARSDRNFCLARIIEALRLYAAAHEGRLPNQLSDIDAVPVPSDPLTGGPFVYRLTGDTAVLETPLFAELPASQHGLRYEIKVAH